MTDPALIVRLATPLFLVLLPIADCFYNLPGLLWSKITCESIDKQLESM